LLRTGPVKKIRIPPSGQNLKVPPSNTVSETVDLNKAIRRRVLVSKDRVPFGTFFGQKKNSAKRAQGERQKLGRQSKVQKKTD